MTQNEFFEVIINVLRGFGSTRFLHFPPELDYLFLTKTCFIANFCQIMFEFAQLMHHRTFSREKVFSITTDFTLLSSLLGEYDVPYIEHTICR